MVAEDDPLAERASVRLEELADREWVLYHPTTASRASSTPSAAARVRPARHRADVPGGGRGPACRRRARAGARARQHRAARASPAPCSSSSRASCARSRCTRAPSGRRLARVRRRPARRRPAAAGRRGRHPALSAGHNGARAPARSSLGARCGVARRLRRRASARQHDDRAAGPVDVAKAGPRTIGAGTARFTLRRRGHVGGLAMRTRSAAPCVRAAARPHLQAARERRHPAGGDRRRPVSSTATGTSRRHERPERQAVDAARHPPPDCEAARVAGRRARARPGRRPT